MNYKIGDIIEDAGSYKYGMVYVIIEEDKAVYVPYFDNYPAPIEPLNEETLPKEIETEYWTPRILGNIKDLIMELKNKRGYKNERTTNYY